MNICVCTFKQACLYLMYQIDPFLWMSYYRCSFVEPQYSGTDIDVSKGPQPTVWDANCGSIFGHELMFSRTLELEIGYSNHFEAMKVAHGGTGKCHLHLHRMYSSP